MNIKQHFFAADAELEVANVKLERSDYVGALAALAKAYHHTRRLLDHIGKITPSKSNVELSAGKE